MNTCHIPLLFYLFLTFTSQISANSLFESSDNPEPILQKKLETHLVKERMFLPFFLERITHYQKALSSGLTKRIRDAKENLTLKHIFMLLFLAFIYGIVHSLGPGHGKLLVSSYAFTHDACIKDAIKAGIIFAIFHTGIAILIFFLFKFYFNLNRSIITNSLGYFLIVSGFIITGLGVVLLYQALINTHTPATMSKYSFKKTSLPVIAAAAGIVPCPGALLILVFSNILDMLWIGILSVIALSAGMALTVSAFGALATGLQKTATIASGGKSISLVLRTMRIMGALIIIGLGLVIIWLQK